MKHSILELFEKAAITSVLKTIQMNLNETQRRLERGEIRKEDIIPTISNALGSVANICEADLREAEEEIKAALEAMEQFQKEADGGFHKS